MEWMRTDTRMPAPEQPVLAHYTPESKTFPNYAVLIWVPAQHWKGIDADACDQCVYDDDTDTEYAEEGWYLYGQPWTEYTWLLAAPRECVDRWASLPD